MLSTGQNVSMADKQVRPRFKKRLHPRHFIKEWREYRGLTQAQLAERVGMTQGNISQLERGIQGYSVAGLNALAEALNCTTWQLLNVDPGKPGIKSGSDDELLWSIWEQAKPAERAQIVSVAKALVGKTGT